MVGSDSKYNSDHPFNRIHETGDIGACIIPVPAIMSYLSLLEVPYKIQGPLDFWHLVLHGLFRLVHVALHQLVFTE